MTDSDTMTLEGGVVRNTEQQLVAISDMGYTYANGFTAIGQFDMKLVQGEIVTLIGPSGCGKSTVLNVIAGLEEASRGRVEVFGEAPAEICRDIGYMFQRVTLFPWRTVQDNVAFPLEVRGVSKRESRRAALPWIRRVGLEHFADYYAYQLSGGMQKRVELAQALVTNPRLLLMDEPFAALDALTRQNMQEEVLGLVQAMGKAMVFVTHDIDEALLISNRVIVMSAGPASGVLAEYHVPLPWPRSVVGLRRSAEAQQLTDELREMLRAIEPIST